ncbi:MAG: DUF1153 domain-containing protein [Paracoccaceae bacterium]|jgi:hypothetical protein|nr:DUF1153 domain-containing protein [Paracoccaceae bacterium]MDG2259154.1 DUF1153 domain-containing protein [Paracoccaceae bacterium]
MYLKKVDRPRTAKLPDGRVLSVSDLPHSATQRWVASRKEIVVRAILHGLIARADALSLYSLTEEELGEWEMGLILRGKTV